MIDCYNFNFVVIKIIINTCTLDDNEFDNAQRLSDFNMNDLNKIENYFYHVKSPVPF